MAKETQELDWLIRDLNEVSNRAVLSAKLEDELNELIACAFEAIGIETITDTNQAKSIFVDICREHLGVDISYIYQTETNLWGNDRDAYDFSEYTVSANRTNGKSIMVGIDDIGLTNQEFFGLAGFNARGQYPTASKQGQYKPNHITDTIDKINDENLPKFEMYLNKVIDKIADIMEGKV